MPRPYVRRKPKRDPKPTTFCNICQMSIVDELYERHLYKKTHTRHVNHLKWMDIFAYGEGVEIIINDKGETIGFK